VTTTTYDFAGKVAVVTGAGRGIGRAYALGLGAAGAAVVVADIDEAGAKETAAGVVAAGGRAAATAVDIADHDSVSAMAEGAIAEFGGIDFLVNNAAIFGGMKLDFLLTVDWAYLQRFLEVNMLGALVCTRACYPSMAGRGGGAVVNQSSSAAYLYAGFYGWAKAGVNSLTQQLAHELGGMNIRVNAIAPGPTDTDAARSVVPGDYMRQLVGSLALKRQGAPEDLVGMCMFLLSDDARWVTGHIFSVDGGQVMRP
jgi:NAD(P)-dependent dehydrogenase (short-subunit alcohol dehydrogenase family)